MELTCPHEFINLGWASLWLLHAITFLQKIVDLRQINAWVWRHPIGGNFPEQNPKSYRKKQ